MTADKITAISIKGLRSIEDVTLRLDELTVLIGENGAGKSSIVEAFELLRKAGAPSFVDNLASLHGGLSLLLRDRAPRLTLGLEIAGDGPTIDYSFSIAPEGSLIVVHEERLVLRDEAGPVNVIVRDRASSSYVDAETGRQEQFRVGAGSLLISAFGKRPPHPAIARTVAMLDGIEVHVPFDVRAFWVCRERRWSAPLRDPTLIQPAASLMRVGDNLANVYHALKNDFGEEHWQATMDLVRLGLGDDVLGINIQSMSGGGQIALAMQLRGQQQQVPASAMADGTLAYLAFVALAQLQTNRSVLVFDEPELHLHPRLLGRVLGIFETIARTTPVVLATHSDRLLDGLCTPAESAVLCRLDPATATSPRTTRLVRPNREALDEWLQTYRGLGDLRAAGVENVVMTEES